ncbi:rhamnogalacturonan lyase family protein [Halalkalibacterium halodurans]|uniref:rhamnogalacturonan lyase family protein n=1 Tax=Halalkalibacterium halodurans TaxID=86665 RepID=UPI002AAA0B60|nr:hypothetical protein [Halalkalibacterium halodurans]MDY7221648.1 hypothetical protein [Halalkalibacterium halodurans]MDY7240924.1 hypothetical protein [Halalkalibacterium halodurans]
MNRFLSVCLVCLITFSSLLTATAIGAEPRKEQGQQRHAYDFGSETSPVEEGFTKVSHTMIYDSERGFGLNKQVNERDRRAPDALRRDFVLDSNFQFIVDVEPGHYYVRVVAGDEIAFNRTGLAVNGVSKGSITSSAGHFASYTEVIEITDDQLVIHFTENGRVNGLELIPVMAPEELDVTEIQLGDPTYVELSWKEVEHANHYHVYRKEDGDEEYTKIAEEQQTVYRDMEAILGATYQYVVTAVGQDEVESHKSEVLTVKLFDEAVEKPNAPDEMKVASALSNGVALEWAQTNDALFYYVYRAKREEGPFTKVATTTEASYTDHDVLTTASFYYKIEAVNEGGRSKATDPVASPIAHVMLRQKEQLDRGLVAVKREDGVFLSWRLLGTEHPLTVFHVYRDGEKITKAGLQEGTNFVDVDGTTDSVYQIKAVAGKDEDMSNPVSVWGDEYLAIPLDKPEGGVTPDGVAYEYTANDASVGDLDGDGQYEIILKWDPTNSKDNSRSGYTGNVYLDAYKLDGTKLWRLDLGRNIRAGAHYTQFLVYDFDGNGRSEVVLKTADGTVDGVGNVIGDRDADYRNSSGYILDGPEYLTIFSGETGEALDTIDYVPPRGNVSDWGDNYGNRVDRFLAGVAYLDGERPSFVMARGYYTRTVLAAYQWDDGKIQEQWVFDSNDPGNERYAGQGNHSLAVADVDGDGKDEIIYGAMVVDHDGTGLYSTGWGHGDANHVSNLNPNRKGLEIFQPHEDSRSPVGYGIRDAETGELLWGEFTGTDVGRAMAADIDPRFDGAELWASAQWDGREGSGLFSVEGESITKKTPQSVNFAIWWTGDLLRELLDHSFDPSKDPHGVGKIEKWDWEKEELVEIFVPEGTRSNNWTKGNPSLQADLFGDWREEVIWPSADSTELRIYTTTEETEHRIPTLMHDSVYRLSVAWQNVGYNQPPHTSYFLGHGMKEAPLPKVYAGQVVPVELKANQQGKKKLSVQVRFDSPTTGESLVSSSVRLFVNGETIQAEKVTGKGIVRQVEFDFESIKKALPDKFRGEVEVSLVGYFDHQHAIQGATTISINN